ncbi:unnamed protein product [Sympodiomycopsis kandeliae]
MLNFKRRSSSNLPNDNRTTTTTANGKAHTPASTPGSMTGTTAPRAKTSPSHIMFGGHTTSSDSSPFLSSQSSSSSSLSTHSQLVSQHEPHSDALKRTRRKSHLSHAQAQENDSSGSSSLSSSPSRPHTRQRITNSIPPPSAPDTTADVKVMPTDISEASTDDVVILVSDMLQRLMTHNDTLPLHPSSLTRFHSRAAPGISIESYLKRITKYTSMEKTCLLILLIYIDRVCEQSTNFIINGLTVHRFVCVSLVCSSKALCDSFSTNQHYSKVGGISLQELNLLEKEFLDLIDWRLSCTRSVLDHYYACLVQAHPNYTMET